jgi:hypothetical protein
MTLRYNPMIRLDIFHSKMKEGDRGKPVDLDVPSRRAVVNQRLLKYSEATDAIIA